MGNPTKTSGQGVFTELSTAADYPYQDNVWLPMAWDAMPRNENGDSDLAQNAIIATRKGRYMATAQMIAQHSDNQPNNESISVDFRWFVNAVQVGPEKTYGAGVNLFNDGGTQLCTMWGEINGVEKGDLITVEFRVRGNSDTGLAANLGDATLFSLTRMY